MSPEVEEGADEDQGGRGGLKSDKIDFFCKKF